MMIFTVCDVCRRRTCVAEGGGGRNGGRKGEGGGWRGAGCTHMVRNEHLQRYHHHQQHSIATAIITNTVALLITSIGCDVYRSALATLLSSPTAPKKAPSR